MDVVDGVVIAVEDVGVNVVIAVEVVVDGVFIAVDNVVDGVVMSVEDGVIAVEGLACLVGFTVLAGLAGRAGLAGFFVDVVCVVNSVIGHAASLAKLWLVSLCHRKVDNMAWSTSIS